MSPPSDDDERITRIVLQLSEEDSDTRKHAAEDLVALGDKVQLAIPKVMPLIQHANHNVRRDTVKLVGRIGKQGTAAIPELIKSLGDQDSSVRRTARISILQVDPEASSLLGALGHPEERIRKSALDALPRLVKLPVPPVNTLVAHLSDNNPDIRQAVIKTIVAVGSPAVPPLIKSLSDNRVREGAIAALGEMKEKASQAIPSLVELADDRNPSLTKEVIHVLGAMGPEAIPPLVGFLDDEKLDSQFFKRTEFDDLLGLRPRDTVSSSTCYALAGMGAVTNLVSALKHSREHVRECAARALASMRGDATTAIPALVSTLTDPSELVRTAAAKAIRDVVPDATARADVLLETFSAERWNLPNYRLWQLAIGEEDALSILKTKVSSGTEAIRKTAGRALRGIIPAMAVVRIPDPFGGADYVLDYRTVTPDDLSRLHDERPHVFAYLSDLLSPVPTLNFGPTASEPQGPELTIARVGEIRNKLLDAEDALDDAFVQQGQRAMPPEPGNVAPPPQPQSAVPPVSGEPPKRPPEQPPAAFGQAYPWITATPGHVVQNLTFDVEVTLRLTAAPDVRGSVSLPKTTTNFTFDVHLLFEDQSLWDTLEFNWAEQTTKAAQFTALKAPKYQGKDEQPDFHTVRVNFYLNNRWRGEGLKNIEILEKSGAPIAGEIPVPPEPEWRKYLNVVSTDSAPPDLLVRIHKIDSKKYLWSFLSPYMNFRGLPNCETIFEGGPEQYIKQQFEPLAGLKTLNKITLGRLEGTCKLIYDEAAPAAFKEVYWTLYNAAKSDRRITLNTIQFVSDEPFVPWELMYIADPLRGRDVRGEILSVRHAVGRWFASESCQISPRISVKEMAIFASDYKNVTAVTRKLQGAEQEAIDLEKLYQTKPKAIRHPLVSDEVMAFLEEGKAQVMHFCCHGNMDQQTPSLSVILLEDDQSNFVPAVVVRESSQRGIGSQHPLVFLNACQVGGAGAELSFVTGWPQAFLSMGASAVIAPLWSVHDQPAHDIAKQFYSLVIGNDRISIGAALQHIRSQFKTNNDTTYLAYLLYGDPTAMVSVD